MGLKQYLAETFFLTEGKLADELAAQIMNFVKKFRGHNLPGWFGMMTIPQFKELAQEILDIDPTPKKSWRFIIKDWLVSGEIQFPEDAPMLNRDLQLAKKFNITQRKGFTTRASFAEFLQKLKDNRGIVDEIFNYTFDIDYNDTRFTIYHIQEKDKAEYIEKLGQCTTWCVSTEKMFGYYQLPYYLLVDKKERKHYAIVPTGGQFKDSKQNKENSQKKFEEFDKILDLRGRYFYKILPRNNDTIDNYIYEHPTISRLEPRKQIEFMDVLSGLAAIFPNIKDPTEEVQIFAVKQYPFHIENIKNPSEAVQLAALVGNIHIINYIDNPTPTAIKTSDAHIINAIEQDYSLFSQIKNPSKEVQIAALEVWGDNIQYIKNPSEDLQIVAVQQGRGITHAIDHIANPSEKVQLAAVNTRGLSIQYIDDPSEKVQIAAVENDPEAIKGISSGKLTMKVKVIAARKDESVLGYLTKPDEVSRYLNDPKLAAKELGI